MSRPSTRRRGDDSGDDVLVEESRARVRASLATREARATLAVGVALLAVIAFLLAVVPDRGRPAGLVELAALTLAYGLAARVQFEVGSGVAVPTQLVFVPMLFAAPPALVPLLVAGGLAVAAAPEVVRGRAHPARLALGLLNAVYAVGAVIVIWLAGQPSASPTPAHLAILAVAVGAQFGFDYAGWAVRGVAPVRELTRALAWAWLVDVALTPIGFALALADVRHPYAFLAALPLMGLLWRFARDRQHHYDRMAELSDAYRGTALLLGDMVEADDAYTGLHSHDVVALVLAVADRLGLSRAEREQAEFTALLHDVGKVNIPKAIINKAGPLTAEERAVIETHTLEGERMLEQVGGLLGRVGRLVRSCHERWDGGGYPDGLAGEQIPLVARIVCACDAFSAMTTDRSYRRAMPAADALVELRRCSGTQFDPAVVDALAAIAGARGEQPLAQAA